jgi:hypothetical protein
MSNTVRHEIEHGLEPMLAVKAAHAAAASYVETYSEYVSGRWEKATLFRLKVTIGGKAFDGMMTVNKKYIRFSLSNVPFVYRAMAPTAFGMLEKEANVWIAKAKGGQL